MKNKTFLICAQCGSVADASSIPRLADCQQRQQLIGCCNCNGSRFFITSLSPAIFEDTESAVLQPLRVN